MAVAFGNVGVTTYVGGVTSISFSFTNSGNAICILAKSDYGSTAAGTWTGTYAGQALTNDFSVIDPAFGYGYFNYIGFHKLNAAASGTIVLTCSEIQSYIDATVVSVSGASTSSFTGSNNTYAVLTLDDATHTTPALNVTSQTNDLVVSFFSLDCDPSYSYVTGISGTTRLSNVTSPAATFSWAATTAGASPTVGVTGSYYGSSGDVSVAIYFLAGFSFAPSGAGPTPHAYVGFSGVANQVQTMPGCASGVVANASSGYGDDVAGSGVVDVFFCNEFVIPTTPSGYILMEGTGYVLQESDSKIYMEQ